jgi:hypothetical protein
MFSGQAPKPLLPNPVAPPNPCSTVNAVPPPVEEGLVATSSLICTKGGLEVSRWLAALPSKKLVAP